jgi:hypothetical protein
MKPATLSWCTEMVLMSDERSYSASMNWMLPWPHRPNTCGTFSWIR